MPDPHRAETVISQLTRTFVGGGSRSTTSSRCPRRCCSCWPPIRPSPTSRAWRASSPATVPPAPLPVPRRAPGLQHRIVVLAIVAIALIVAFGGSVSALIPLYTVGVFLAFTLSQSGMVRRWWRRGRGGRAGSGVAINGLGAAVNGRCRDRGRRHQVRPRRLARAHPHSGPDRGDALHPPALRRIGDEAGGAGRRGDPAAAPAGTDRGPGQWHQPGRGPGRECRALDRVGRSGRPHLGRSEADAAQVRERWDRQLPAVPLVVVESPYRALVGPLLAYLDVLDASLPAGEDEPVTFV